MPLLFSALRRREGKRRYADGTDDPTGSITSETTRGFTGHEMIDDVDIVNMNAPTAKAVKLSCARLRARDLRPGHRAVYVGRPVHPRRHQHPRPQLLPLGPQQPALLYRHEWLLYPISDHETF